ncbi:MAG: ATP-binding protein [Prolixibacteraceae bacterium]|nr:ATP-binding protein [Prolixibacteraceae bacterium]
MKLILRPIVKRIISNLDNSEFSVIVGPRQSGKTSVLTLLKDYLEKESKQVFYFSLEDPEILSKLDSHPGEIFSLLPTVQNKIFILIDEIQYLKNPTNFLKYHFDLHRDKIKIICTGSSAFYIDQKFKDSLAGRKEIFNLYTLSFEEFLFFKTNSNNLAFELDEMRSREDYHSIHSKKIRQLLNEYLTYGGYPKVVLSGDIDRKKSILSELSQSFIRRDILESGIRNEEKYFFLLKILAAQTGGLLNLNKLSTSLRLSTTALENYITTLRKTFQIHLVRPFYRNMKKELTKMPVVYFNDLGMRNILLNHFQPVEFRIDKGELIENFMFLQLRNKYAIEEIRFWRTTDGNEVDFVVSTEFEKGFAIECKFDENLFNQKKYSKFTNEYPNFPLTVKSYHHSKNSTSLFSI